MKITKEQFEENFQKILDDQYMDFDGTVDSVKGYVTQLEERVKLLQEALREVDAKDTYSEKSYGPFAVIARKALAGGKDGV